MPVWGPLEGGQDARFSPTHLASFSLCQKRYFSKSSMMTFALVEISLVETLYCQLSSTRCRISSSWPSGPSLSQETRISNKFSVTRLASFHTNHACSATSMWMAQVTCKRPERPIHLCHSTSGSPQSEETEVRSPAGCKAVLHVQLLKPF